MTNFHFTCDQPDFVIRTVPDGTVFRVNKAKLAAGSVVFRDMFAICDDTDPNLELKPNASNVTEHAGSMMASISQGEMEVPERPEIFGLFLALIHGPTSLLEEIGYPDSDEEESPLEPSTIAVPPPSPKHAVTTTNKESLHLPELIPYPLLSPLCDLLDKYDVTRSYVTTIVDHLKRNAPQHPLQIYSLSHQLTFTNLLPVASYASQFLLSPPLETYTLDEIDQNFPSLRAYHRLTLLHAHRKEKLREILITEQIFPHDYGLCPKHNEGARAIWAAHKTSIEARVTAGIDLPAEMAIVKGSYTGCPTCELACERALAMIQYKVNKIAYTFDRVPGAM
ncbi:hypothetical protein FRB94_009056 [Tulasnella sp. JGI-2019a]|nr:hypothetical protein FRB94_009056 [Tulasnella sp. JGI-2019a]